MAAKPAPKDKAPAAPAAGGGGKRMLIPALIAVVVAVAAGGGVAFFMSKKADKAEPGAEVPAEAAAEHAPPPGAKPEYIALDPPFVVNLADASGDRYLQVEVQLMSRQPKISEALELHMPVIRNRLLMLFSQQTTEGLRTREAKEKLQAEALSEVKSLLKEATGSEGIEALYFTSFVTQ